LPYLFGAVALGAVFIGYAVRLKRQPTTRLAMKTFGYSIVYLMGLFSLLLADHYLPR
jgi:protoheme IX farnesyltransferase